MVRILILMSTKKKPRELFARTITFDHHLDIKIIIFEPIELEMGWECKYQIQWPNKQNLIFSAHGIDKLQSLLYCLRLIDERIKLDNDWKDGKITWLGDIDFLLGPFNNRD
jgi:hypothetical protein